MQMISNNPADFNEVECGFIEESPIVPYLMLSMPNKKESLSYFNELLDTVKNAGHHKVTSASTKETLSITVTGKTAISMLLDLHFEKYSDYPSEIQEAPEEELIDSEICTINKNWKLYVEGFMERIESPNQFKSLLKPKKSTQFNKYQPLIPEDESGEENNLPESNNEVSRAIKIKHPMEGKEGPTFYLKTSNGYQRKLAEIEAFAAACYRFMLGFKQAPNAKVVFDGDNRVATISEEIQGFQDASDANYTNNVNLLDTGIAELLVASYIYEENDLSYNNWGFNKQGKASRIDFDLTFWPLTCKYFGLHSNQLFTQSFKNTPAKTFIIDENDIRTFPVLHQATPFNWQIEIDDLIMTPAFQEKKWQAFLKAVLLHEQKIIQAAGDIYFGSPHAQKKYPAHVNNRLGKLKETLMQMPEFQDYIANHPDAIHDIKKQIADNYNAFIKTKDVNLKIDLESIQTSYEDIKEACKTASQKAKKTP